MFLLFLFFGKFQSHCSYIKVPIFIFSWMQQIFDEETLQRDRDRSKGMFDVQEAHMEILELDQHETT